MTNSRLPPPQVTMCAASNDAKWCEGGEEKERGGGNWEVLYVFQEGKKERLYDVNEDGVFGLRLC